MLKDISKNKPRTRHTLTEPHNSQVSMEPLEHTNIFKIKLQWISDNHIMATE